MIPDRPQPPDPPWSTALFSLIHPVRVAVVEAFLRIDRPMSALLLQQVLGSFDLETVAYHLHRLAEAGVLVEHPIEPRGPTERFFVLAT